MPRNEETSARMRAESRAQILKAARGLFAERGYFNCKVSDIAREAGMSQGNVYWYFDSKDALLQAVLAEGFSDIEAMLQDVAAHPGAADDVLDYLFERSIALYSEQLDFMRLLNALMAHGGVPYLQELGFDTRAIGTLYHEHLRPVFVRAQAEAVVADEDPDQLIMLYFSFFNGLLITYGRDWTLLSRGLLYRALMRMLGRATE
jgi:AcrR family transcriptional regulator